MATPTTAVRNVFNAGEWSPLLFGRDDLNKYKNSCATLTNFMAQRHGGAARRPGTQYIADAKDSGLITRQGVPRLVRFSFSTTQNYILEFGVEYIRFYRDQGQLQDGGTGAPTIEATPYASADIAGLKFVQSADVLYIAHPDYQTRKLQRTSGDDSLGATWSLTTISQQYGPFQEMNTSAVTLQYNDGTGRVVASDDTFVSTDAPSSDNTGRLIRITDGSKWFTYRVTGYIDSNHVAVTRTAGNTGVVAATKNWRLGSWSDTSGWPSTLMFHQNRLWFGATATQPQTIWASNLDSYEDMRPSDNTGNVLDIHAIGFTIAARQINKIEHLHSGTRGFIIMTAGGEWVGTAGGSSNTAMTPSNFSVTQQSTYGSDTRVGQPTIGNAILFMQPDAKVMREFLFRFDLDGYVAPDITLLSSHITGGGLIDIAYQKEPDSTVWATRKDGALIGLTYEREEDVVAWHKHQLGGEGEVQSVAVIREDAQDEVWMSVKRDINGSTVHYIEMMRQPFTNTDDHNDAFFVDSGLSYSGGPVTTLSGLDHLEGLEVAILADGASHPPQQVVSGSITLDYAASKVSIGLAYESVLKTTPLVPPGPKGYNTKAKLQRPYKLFIHLDRSLGGEVRFYGSTVVARALPLVWRSAGDDMDSPPELFTGIKEFGPAASDDRLPQIQITTSDPQPMNILAVIAEFSIGGV